MKFERYFIILKNKLKMFGLMLKGKTAVVTGSLSGIGLGIAQALAGCGANVVLNGFAPEDEIARTEKALTSANSQAKFIFADLTKPADSRDLVKKSIAHFGKVDILVNNAGMQHIDKTEDFPDAQWERVLALNLSSNFYAIAEALPGMKQRKWGRIINIASAHGLVASPNKSAYCASKFGVVGLTKVVALENAKEGVTCNAICPGFVMTPLIEKQIQIIMEKRGISFEEASEVLCSEKHPTGRLGRPEDLGALAAFLCSDNAVQMTGSSYSMDGGWTAI